MANFTRKAIETSFLKLLTDRPISRITVKDIVADCGINRNTFYYYFEDIPKLIETMVEEEAAGIIDTYPTVDSIEECLKAFASSALTKKRAILHIYDSASRDIYELYLWKICDHVIQSYIATVLGDRKIDDSDLAIIKRYLSGVSFGLISNWLKDGMTDDIFSVLERIFEIKKGMISEMIARCEKP